MAKKKGKSSPQQIEDYAKPSEATQEQSKDSPKIITRKDLIITYIVFFLIFGIVGYMRGRTDNFLPKRMHIDVRKNNYLKMAENPQGKRIIAYQCESEPLLVWDIDSNKIQPRQANIKLPEDYEYSPAIFKNELLITAFLSGGGGIVSVFTAKEVFSFAASSSGKQLLNSGSIKLIVVAVIASILGYQVGYDLAINQKDCSDYRYYTFLQNESLWLKYTDEFPGLEQNMWLARKEQVDKKNRETLSICNVNDSQTKQLQEEKLKKAKVDFEKLSFGEKMNKEADLTSADFDILQTFETTIDDFNKNCRAE